MSRVVRMGKAYRESGYGYREVSAPVVLCDCGEEVTCSQYTNTCSCGRDYSMSGSMLAPRSQWGEETGEHPCDIANL